MMERGRTQSLGYWYSYDHCGGGMPGTQNGDAAAEFSGVPGWLVMYTRFVYFLVQFHGAILLSSSRSLNMISWAWRASLVVWPENSDEVMFVREPKNCSARL